MSLGGAGASGLAPGPGRTRAPRGGVERTLHPRRSRGHPEQDQARARSCRPETGGPPPGARRDRARPSGQGPDASSAALGGPWQHVGGPSCGVLGRTRQGSGGGAPPEPPPKRRGPVPDARGAQRVPRGPSCTRPGRMREGPVPGGRPGRLGNGTPFLHRLIATREGTWHRTCPRTAYFFAPACACRGVRGAGGKIALRGASKPSARAPAGAGSPERGCFPPEQVGRAFLGRARAGEPMARGTPGNRAWARARQTWYFLISPEQVPPEQAAWWGRRPPTGRPRAPPREPAGGSSPPTGWRARGEPAAPPRTGGPRDRRLRR